MARIGQHPAHLGLLAGRDVTFIARHAGRPPLPVTGSVGDRFPAAITAAGTILLAQLSDDELAELYPDDSAFPKWTPKSTSSLTELMAKIERVRADGFAVDEAYLIG